MDIKEQIGKLAERVMQNDELKEQFQKEPIKAVEKVLGVDLPDDVVEQIIQGVKAKISVDQVADVLGGLKKLF